MALPGISSTRLDRFYGLQRTDTAIGPRVAAIGYRDTADGTGNVGNLDPYFATNEKDVITAFGNGSHLHKAYLELAAGGAPRIYLVAVPANATDSDLINDTNSVVTNAFAAAETVTPDVILPYGRGANSLDWDDWATPATPGGADKFGFYADNSASGNLSMAVKVATLTEEISKRSNPAISVLGVKPFVADEQDTDGGFTSGGVNPAQAASHLGLTNLYDNTQNGNANGGYVAVVATEMRPVGYPLEFGWSNGAGVFAGQMSQTDPWIGMTGRTVQNCELIRYSTNRVQQDALLNRGVIPLGLDFTRRPTWIDGRTFAQNVSDYVRLTTVRIVHAVEAEVRAGCRGFIGMPATLENRNGLETAISSRLRGLQQLGALLAADFIVTYFARSNSVDIDIVLQPAFEIRNIDLTISLQL